MLHANEANSLDTHTVLWGLRFKLNNCDGPDNLPCFPLNPLVAKRAGLWSSDQGSDNDAHATLTCWFHPVTMWCKWKWKHLLSPCCQSYDISIAMTQLYYHLGSHVGYFRLDSRIRKLLIGWLVIRIWNSVLVCLRLSTYESYCIIWAVVDV